MRGGEPTIRDIELDLHKLVDPANVLSNQSLSPDAIPEEEFQAPYKIDTCCGTCERPVRLVVTASNRGIHHFEQLLFSELTILCPGCARGKFRHGRS